jgi:2-polyprenyl-3-methyl-5-hydroxy-6-metoxy-1,4-benzoquinol methylase
MPNIQKINESIDNFMKSLLDFKESLKEINSEVSVSQTQNQSSNPKVSEPEVARNTSTDDLKDFESLRKALESDKWPEAVNPNLICDPSNEQDKLERGRGIVELMIEPDLKGLKVLDFGCAEGHVAFVASEYEPTVVVGYDCEHNDRWNSFQKDNLVYTDNWKEVLKNGPYDVIILFDVIDHVKNENAVGVLRKAREALSEEGRIYMRCHPFISRHGTHLYHHLNKAYAHLVFTQEELKTIVPEQKFVEESINVLFPLRTYDEFLQQANLEIVHRREITSKVDSFFKIPKIAERIMENNALDSFPDFQMSLDFIDYVLKKLN